MHLRIHDEAASHGGLGGCASEETMLISGEDGETSAAEATPGVMRPFLHAARNRGQWAKARAYLRAK